MTFTKYISVGLVALVLGSASWAEDTGLYAAPAPDDAAFVRFIGFENTAQADFAGHTFDLPQERGAYIAISAERLMGVEPGQHVSLVKGPNQTVEIAEPGRDTRTKVHLFVVNAGAAPVSLKLADGSMTVIEHVAPGTAQSRAVNPVSARLALFADGQTEALAAFDVALRRGQNLSFVARAEGAEVVEHRFGPVVQ